MAAALALAQARYIALAAQGLDDARPTGRVTASHIHRVCERVGILQIDAVNVLTRAHYLPIFSRLGAYKREELDRMCDRAPYTYVESWAHEASLIPAQLWHLQAARHRAHTLERSPRAHKILTERPELLSQILGAYETAGPLTSREVERYLKIENPRPTGQWGENWGDVKAVVEYLMWSGQLAATGRNQQFERSYDLPERVIPRASFQRSQEITNEECYLELVRIAAKAQGVASLASLADYFRLTAPQARGAVEKLLQLGELEEVEIQGLRGLYYLDTAARHPRKAEVATLVSPFDSLIWHRPRTEQIFGMRYRLEMYTPAYKRTYGYYVLPFLWGSELVARIDLKADRAARALCVRQLSWEAHAPQAARQGLAEALKEMAQWLELERILMPV